MCLLMHLLVEAFKGKCKRSVCDPVLHAETLLHLLPRTNTAQEALASPETAAICHLILDTCSELPGWHPRLGPHHAVGVLLRCAAEQPRLAPKVAAAFHLTVDAFSVADQVALLDAISGLLDASATSAAGVALLLHFGPPVQRHFHVEAVLEDLVRAGGEGKGVCLDGWLL